MKPARNQRGSAALETIMTVTTLSLILIGGFTVTYASFAHVWLERAAYETLICLSTRASVSECETKLRESTANGLKIGTLSDLHLDRSKNQARIELKFSLENRVIVRQKQTLRLPLVSGVFR
jgi:hypothetical protein